MALGYTKSQHRKLAASYAKEFQAKAKKAKAAAVAGRCATAERELIDVAAWHGARLAERTDALGKRPKKMGKAIAPVIKFVRKHCKCVKAKHKA